MLSREVKTDESLITSKTFKISPQENNNILKILSRSFLSYRKCLVKTLQSKFRPNYFDKLFVTVQQTSYLTFSHLS